MYKKLGCMYLVVYQKFGNNQTLLAGIIQVFRMVGSILPTISFG